MATIGDSNYGLVDAATKTGAAGNVLKVVQFLERASGFLPDIPLLPSNNGSNMEFLASVGLPKITIRMINKGVPITKGETAKRTATPAMFESRSSIDKRLLDMMGNKAAHRMTEDKAHLISMNNTMEETLFYGNPLLDPKTFTGIANYYNTLNTSEPIHDNVYDGGGESTDNTSIYGVTWGENTTFGFYPKDSKGGVRMTDLGEVDAFDADNNAYRAYQTLFEWDMGLAIKDWRYNFRIANIDVSELKEAGTSNYAGADLINLLIEAINRLPSNNLGNLVLYCNREVHTALHKLASNKANVNLTIENFAGKPIPAVLGFPIKKSDSILNTEAEVTT